MFFLLLKELSDIYRLNGLRFHSLCQNTTTNQPLRLTLTCALFRMMSCVYGRVHMFGYFFGIIL